MRKASLPTSTMSLRATSPIFPTVVRPAQLEILRQLRRRRRGLVAAAGNRQRATRPLDEIGRRLLDMGLVTGETVCANGGA